jgi:hypothetical protein
MSADKVCTIVTQIPPVSTLTDLSYVLVRLDFQRIIAKVIKGLHFETKNYSDFRAGSIARSHFN